MERALALEGKASVDDLKQCRLDPAMRWTRPSDRQEGGLVASVALAALAALALMLSGITAPASWTMVAPLPWKPTA
jgi:hypothetical protein